MNGFKLIAIRPLEECSPKHLKVLKAGFIYKLYQDYTFRNENDELIETNNYDEVKSINYIPTAPENLYSTENFQINISAIVGMNGSGKSSLLELLFATIYNIAIKIGVLEEGENDEEVIEKLKILDGINIEVFYSIADVIFRLKFSTTNSIEFSMVDYESSKSVELVRSFKLNQLLDQQDIKKLVKDFFFYTITINYSLYGLNASQMGLWIKSLFHKNDAYQTPLVINPFRDNGSINVSREYYLAKQRLLSNIVKVDGESNVFALTDRQKVNYLTFSINRKKIAYLFKRSVKNETETFTFEKLFETDAKQDILDKVYEHFLGTERPSENIKFRDEVEKYVIKKIIKIARTYPEYRRFFRDDLIYYNPLSRDTKTDAIKLNSHFNEIEQYLGLLVKDKSHLTFKLRQALNYLRNAPLREDGDFIWGSSYDDNDETSEFFKITVGELASRIKKIQASSVEIIELIPPSIFDIELHLTDGKSSSLFSELSSGEQQLIHSIQSIVYHAINVNSVFSSVHEENKLTFNFINLVLDEVELYFHPEYQRKFVAELIHALRRSNLKHTKKINVLFSTHSPFILSDIPVSNILRIEEGKPKTAMPEKTFGANIHDLLANDFFMRNGFMGSWANSKINAVVNFLHDQINQNKQKDRTVFSAKADSIEDGLLTKEECGAIISIVGEPILYTSLIELYSEAFPNDRKSLIDQQIEYLNALRR
jgi:energy-coupling factor transporter ATP-binding protein EcfA2